MGRGQLSLNLLGYCSRGEHRNRAIETPHQPGRGDTQNSLVEQVEWGRASSWVRRAYRLPRRAIIHTLEVCRGGFHTLELAG